MGRAEEALGRIRDESGDQADPHPAPAHTPGVGWGGGWLCQHPQFDNPLGQGVELGSRPWLERCHKVCLWGCSEDGGGFTPARAAEFLVQDSTEQSGGDMRELTIVYSYTQHGGGRVGYGGVGGGDKGGGYISYSMMYRQK